MKAYLMFKDKNFVLDDNGMYNSIVTLDDLEIESVLKYASDSDALIHNVLKKSLASPLLDLEEIEYRQEVLKDSLDNPEIVRDLYQICVDTLNKIFEQENFVNKKSNKENLIVVTTIEALMQKMISKNEIYQNVLEFKVGKNFDLEQLKQNLR